MPRVQGWGITRTGHRGASGVLVIFFLVWMVVKRVHLLVKIHWAVFLWSGHSFLFMSYINENLKRATKCFAFEYYSVIIHRNTFALSFCSIVTLILLPRSKCPQIFNFLIAETEKYSHSLFITRTSNVISLLVRCKIYTIFYYIL